jgi:hypothetical protein
MPEDSSMRWSQTSRQEGTGAGYGVREGEPTRRPGPRPLKYSMVPSTGGKCELAGGPSSSVKVILCTTPPT